MKSKMALKSQSRRTVLKWTTPTISYVLLPTHAQASVAVPEEPITAVVGDCVGVDGLLEAPITLTNFSPYPVTITSISTNTIDDISHPELPFELIDSIDVLIIGFLTEGYYDCIDSSGIEISIIGETTGSSFSITIPFSQN